MDFSTLLLVLFSFILTCIIFLASNSKPRKSGKLPPGPRPLPIIGNILDIRGIAYRSLAKLSQTYGPIMYLKMGYTETVVFSSPETAKLVLQKYDQSLSGRIVPMALKSIDLDKISVAWLPAEDHQWRKLRKAWKEQMLSMQRLDASKGLRGEKLQKLCEYLDQCCVKGQVVNLAEVIFTTSLNMMSATLFSIDFADIGSDSSHEYKDVLSNVMKCIGTPSFADYFPILKYFDLQGNYRRTKYYVEKFGAILDKIIEERLASRGTSEKSDSLEALLELNQKPVPELSRIDIKYLLLDSFLGGTDSSPNVVQWVMTQLLRNPTKMLKAKTELSDVIGQHGVIQESDISKLPYLRAIIKETLRLYPPGPLLVPHKAMAEVEINGYIIPKNAQIFVNLWAIGRDPSVWSEPDSFIPERFLDFKNQYFEFIPFSAGRRICPGMPLANRLVPILLATLLHNYDWKLEEGLKPEDIDMSEEFITVLHRTIPLKAIPIKK